MTVHKKGWVKVFRENWLVFLKILYGISGLGGVGSSFFNGVIMSTYWGCVAC
jgi:hypothetical protein